MSSDNVAQDDFLPFGLDSTAIFVLSIVAVGLVLSITLVKIWISLVRRLHFFLSDYLAVTSSLALLASLGLAIYYIAIPMQTGQSTADLEQDQNPLQVGYLKAIFAIEILWPTSLALSKLSILLLFRRVFKTTGLRVMVVCSMIYVILLYLSVLLGTILQCQPVDSFWRIGQTDSQPACLNRKVFFLFSNIPNIVLNAVMLALPIYELWRLTIRLAVRIFLWSIFLLGSLALAASIVRFVEISQVDGIDAQMARAGASAAVIVEATIAVLCAYLPTLCTALWRMRPAAARFTGGARKARGKSRRGRQSGSRYYSEADRDSTVSIYVKGRRVWPRSRSRPRPMSFIDPTKPLPREPANEFIKTLQAGARSTVPLGSRRLGGIWVDESIVTTVDRRSKLVRQYPNQRFSTSFGTVVEGPEGIV